MADDGSQFPRIPPRLQDWLELNRRVHDLSVNILARLEAIEASYVEEAPQDGQRYVRRDGAWEVLP